jgi:hypothetical protein
MPDSDLVTEIARRHLPPGIADRWLRLQRPAARLRHATANDRVA